MKLNKKGLNNLMFIIIIFGVIALITMFGLIFVKEVGDQYLSEPLTDISLEILNNTNSPSDFSTTINNAEIAYNNIVIPYDLLFLIIWIMVLGGVFVTAYKVKKMPVYSWLGMLFIGSMMFLLITGFIAQFTDWFLDSFYNNLFSDIDLNTPIMDFYFENMSLINFVTFAIALLLNRIDVTLEMGGGRVEE